jgi:MoaA/NifB/PqqE/SkfB family radical SAM enzyme
MSLPSGMKQQKTGQTPMHTINTLYFYLTEGCNLSCRHCWMGPRFDPTGNLYPTLPVELFETSIREAKPLGLSGVKLTGGEPLLHPRFTRLLEIVRREELKLVIETNGLLCTPEIAAEIAKSPNRFISVVLMELMPRPTNGCAVYQGPLKRPDRRCAILWPQASGRRLFSR